MTIALGILATDGVVLAADSEISTDGDLKGTDTKIVAATHEIQGALEAHVGVAGAGSLGYFQSIRFKAAMVALKAMCVEPFMTSNVEQDLERLLTDFFARHVIPFLPNAPELSVLVAGYVRQQGLLLATEKTAVRVSPYFDAIGAGGLYATQLLSAYYCPMEVESAALLAFYVMMRVKDTIMGCGQDTQVIVLRNGKAKILPGDLIKDCEHKLANYAALQKNALFSLIGVHQDTAYVKDFLDALRGDFDTARQAIKSITSPISQT